MKIVAFAFALVLASAAHAQQAPACQASQLALTNDVSHDADFNGMSHTGTVLVLRNTSSSTCILPPFLKVTFFDNGKQLDAIGKAPGSRGMHPGPVMPPTRLEPGASASASIRWVNDEVFQNSFCIDPTRLTVTVEGKPISIAFDGHLCGEASQPIVFELSRFSAPSAAR